MRGSPAAEAGASMRIGLLHGQRVAQVAQQAVPRPGRHGGELTAVATDERQGFPPMEAMEGICGESASVADAWR